MFASTAAFVLLVFGAGIGALMAVYHVRGKASGKAVGVMHGVWTLSGLALLAVGAADLGVSTGWWFVAAFGLVAVGGAYLFWRQWTGKPWPDLVIWAHGGAALLTLSALGVWLFTGVGGNTQLLDEDVSDVPQDVEAVRAPPPGTLPNKDALDDGPTDDWPYEGTEGVTDDDLPRDAAPARDAVPSPADDAGDDLPASVPPVVDDARLPDGRPQSGDSE